MNINVVSRMTQAPAVPATTITREDETHWWIRCEGGCGAEKCQGKRTWVPVDYRDESRGYTEVTHTAPEAIRCGACGPWVGVR